MVEINSFYRVYKDNTEHKAYSLFLEHLHNEISGMINDKHITEKKISFAKIQDFYAKNGLNVRQIA